MITVNDIEHYFAMTGLPKFTVELVPGQLIKAENAGRFIDGSIATITSHADNKTFEPYWEALVAYYEKVKQARAILSNN